VSKGTRVTRTIIRVCSWLSALFIIFILFATVRGPVYIGIKQAKYNAWIQQGRQIGSMMFSYATDNTQGGNAYPEGNSSTEVFQKLIDGNYVTDPGIFYVPLPGKTKALPGQKLKPENVCWDVTCCVDSNSSDLVPLVFLTGYKVTYTPGGSAVPIIKPWPQFREEPRTWLDWWHGVPDEPPTPGIAIFYKGNNAMYRKLETPQQSSDGIITNFVPPDFKPDGKTYRQLTPDGPLP